MKSFKEVLNQKKYLSCLAPMQDISTLNFISVLDFIGAPSFYITEFLRVHENTSFEEKVRLTATSKNLNAPVSVQLLGENLEYIEEIIERIKGENIEAIDFNIGCPMPKICKKNVAGALLKNPKKIEEIIDCINGCWDKVFSVKFRVGYSSDENFDEIIDIFSRKKIDFVSLHCRLVSDGYRGSTDYSYAKKAAKILNDKNIALFVNGDLTSAKKALEIVKDTGCQGFLSGRSAIGNPWIFRQFDELVSGRQMFVPKLENVRNYIDLLMKNIYKEDSSNLKKASYMKKFLNFIGIFVDEDGRFLYETRRATSLDEMKFICDKFLIQNNNANKLYQTEPFKNIFARPNMES